MVWSRWMMLWEKERLADAVELCREQGHWGKLVTAASWCLQALCRSLCAALGWCSYIWFSCWELAVAVTGSGERGRACAGLLALALLAVAKHWHVACAWADIRFLMLGLSKGKCGFSTLGGFLLL